MAQNYSRGSMTGRPARGPRNLPPQQNIVVMVDSYDPDMLRARKSNPDKDWMMVRLIHDVPELGLKAEFGPDGSPLTVVKVRMPLPKRNGQPLTDTRRRDIYGLSQKKSGGPPMDQGSQIVLEKAYVNKDGEICASYSHGGPTYEEQNDNIKQVFAQVMVCVTPERTRKDRQDPTKTVWSEQQTVFVADHISPDGGLVTPGKTETVEVDGAVQVVKRNLEEAVRNLVSNTVMGTPGFQLHARRVLADAPEGASAEEKARVKAAQAEIAANPDNRISAFIAGWNKPVLDEAGKPVMNDDGRPAYVPLTADEMLEKFWSYQGAAQAIKQLWNDPKAADEWQFEFLPMMCLNQAPSLIPSLNKKDNKEVDNSQRYCIYDEIDPNNKPSPVFRAEDGGKIGEAPIATLPDGRQIGIVDAGWGLSHVMVARMSKETGYFFATYENLASTLPAIFALPDIPTPNMPAYHREAVMAEARRLGENRRDYVTTLFPRNTETAAAPAPGM
jgi:hypothetical protein